MLACFSSLYTALPYRTSISQMPPCLLSVCPWSLCSGQTHPPPSPCLWFKGRKGIKVKEEKKERRKKYREQTLNTSSSSRIRSSCREWLLGSTITFCIVPLSEGQKSTRLMSSNHTHAFNYRVKQIRLRSNEPLELRGISKSRTRLLVEKTPPAPPAVCLSLPMFAFELGMIAMTSFQKQNQLWQKWEWKLLRQVKDHKKGKMQLYPHQYGSFGLGIWAAEQGGGGGGGEYSNSSWKCLIRLSPHPWDKAPFQEQIWVRGTGYSSKIKAGGTERRGCSINTGSWARDSQSSLLNANVHTWTITSMNAHALLLTNTHFSII